MHLTFFRCESWFPRPLDEVFAFFSDARNLEAITPPWLQFRVLTPEPIVMRVGLRIDYRLRVRGLPLRWQSEITAWEPPFRFMDEQRVGPYRVWQHEHRFQESNGGTWCGDYVKYAAPGGPFRRLVEKLWVNRDVAKIFEYRRKVLSELLGLQATGNLTSKMEPRSGTL
jgi:ligand-binding SRPBCC domain-containing protein